MATKKTPSNDDKAKAQDRLSINDDLSAALKDLVGRATTRQLIAWVKKYRSVEVKLVIREGIESLMKKRKKK